jgi:hypothetical protein
MQHQHHIHDIATVLWPRCTKVEIRNDLIYCELAKDRQYDLVGAYPKGPHIQFLNCETDDDLQSFVRAWGPLYLVHTPGDEEIRLGKAVRKLDECQAHRRWLRAVKRMIDACKGLEDERSSLVEYLAAEVDMERTDATHQPDKAPFFYEVLRHRFHYVCDSVAWAASTDIGSVKKALAYSVEMNVSAPSGYGLKVDERPKGFEIRPHFSLGTLWDALRWMLWFDEWNRWPPLPCLECHRIFRPSTAHKMKYCTHECAHRATNREWRRKDLRQRKKTLKAEADGGTNGPRKAR